MSSAVLVVDDQPADLDWLFDRIAERGYTVEWSPPKTGGELFEAVAADWRATRRRSSTSWWERRT